MTDIEIKKLASSMGHVFRPTSLGSLQFPKANFLIVCKLKKLIILFFLDITLILILYFSMFAWRSRVAYFCRCCRVTPLQM